MNSSAIGLARVSYGLRLIYLSLILAVVTFLAAFVAILAAVNAGQKLGPADLGQGPLALILQGMIFLSLLSNVMAIIGKFYCLQVPEKAQASTLIFLSVAFSVLSVLIQVGAAIPATAMLVQPIAPASSLFVMVGYVIFLIFLRRLAEYLGRMVLAARARSILVWSFLLSAVTIAGMAAVMTAATQEIKIVGGLVLFAASIIALVQFVRYVNLLPALRSAIENHANQFDEDY